MKNLLSASIIATLLLFSSQAQAGTNISAKAGAGVFTGDFSGTNFTYGAEVTFDVGGLVAFGGFFDAYDGLNIFGGLARLGFEGTLGFFADAKLGFAEGEFSYGAGIGKSSDLGVIALTPRIGYQFISNDPASGGVFDASLFLTFKLP